MVLVVCSGHSTPSATRASPWFRSTRPVQQKTRAPGVQTEAIHNKSYLEGNGPQFFEKREARAAQGSTTPHFTPVE